MSHIIREIEISKVTGENLTGDAKVIQDWFDKTFNKIELKKLDEYPESIFFVIDGYIYFEQDNKDDRLWCHYDKVWPFFESNFSFNYREVSNLIKYMVEQQLKCKVSTARDDGTTPDSPVEQQLKGKVGVPVERGSLVCTLMELQLKFRVAHQYVSCTKDNNGRTTAKI